MVYFIIIAAVILLDRVVKWAVSTNMEVGETIPLIENVFHITYVQNQGAAFSLMEGKTVILLVLPAVVMTAGIILLVIKRRTWHPMLCTGIAFVCAGGVGNFVDRALRGYVVDMFDFRLIDFPVFNVADILLCVGVGMMAVYVLVMEPRLEKQAKEDGKDGDHLSDSRS